MDISHETDFKLKNNPLPFCWSPLPLQELASKRIAVLLWRHRIYRHDSTSGEFGFQQWLNMQQFDICDLLQVPPVIGHAIEKYIIQHRFRIENWLQLNGYYYNDQPAFISCICINGRYMDFLENDNDKLVARKLLDSDLLNSEQKYQLACSHSLKNDVERLWPSVSNNSCITGANIRRDLMLYYWNQKMMRKPMKIFENAGGTAEYYIISEEYVTKRWYAVEYFWDQLTVDERLSVVVEVLKKGCEKTVANILPKLNLVELNHVLGQIGGLIVSKLATKIQYFDYVLRICACIRELFSMDKLVSVFHVVLLKEFDSRQFLGEKNGHELSITYELWIRSSAQFKNSFLAGNRVENFFDGLEGEKSFWPSKNLYGRDMSFMLELLKTLEFSKRKEIWKRNWRKLILRAKPLYLERFMKLCFDDEDEMIRFKENEMMDGGDLLRKKFHSFVTENFTSEIIDYVNFCTSNKQRAENLLRRFLSYHVGYFASFRQRIQFLTNELFKFDVLVFNIFSNVEYANQFKAEYLLASENPLLPCLLGELDKGYLTFTIKLCTHLTYELCPSEIKREFLEHCRICLINGNYYKFEISEWREFVTSCAGSEENVRIFKESIPLDLAFDNVFCKVIDLVTDSLNDEDLSDEMISNFDVIDNFLTWYFGNEQAVKKYKASKLKDGRKSDVLKIAKSKVGPEMVDIVLKWILD